MKNYYIIKHPYTNSLVKPIKVTVLEECHGFFYLKEFPKLDDWDKPHLDYYGVLIPKDELYETREIALEKLIDSLLYKLNELVNIK